MVTTSDGGNQRRWTTLLFSLASLVGLVICQQSVESGMEADSLVMQSAPMLSGSWIPQSLQADDETNVTVAMALHPSLRRRRRDIFHLYNMMTCATNCDPLSYKGYGCYCGFLGSGAYVDGIDRCCKIHDYCYGATACKHQHLIYFVPYKWKCNYGRPYCVTGYGQLKPKDVCAHHLCECDRQFAECIRHYPCPSTKPVCISNPWRSLG